MNGTLLVGIGGFVGAIARYRLGAAVLHWSGDARFLAGTFVVKLVGSYTNVVGLPLYETVALLNGDGYQVHFGWLSGARG